MIHTVDNRTVLTVQEPWASLIVDGHKDVENRTWGTGYRGRLWIHAGQKVDRGAWAWIGATFGAAQVADWHPGGDTEQALGAIIGYVDLVDCRQFSKSPWWTGSWAWELRNPVRLETPEPKRGRLGLWFAGEQPTPTTKA
jgi:hypothetical protein